MGVINSSAYLTQVFSQYVALEDGYKMFEICFELIRWLNPRNIIIYEIFD